MTTAYLTYHPRDPLAREPFERVADAQDAAASGRGWYCPFCSEPLRDLERDFRVVPRECRWWNREENRLEIRALGEMLDCAVCGGVVCEKAEAERYFAAQRMRAI
ncbi:MAG: hypothetical protein WBE26_03545 [Phycisphaerae bacterium]